MEIDANDCCIKVRGQINFLCERKHSIGRTPEQVNPIETEMFIAVTAGADNNQPGLILEFGINPIRALSCNLAIL